MATKPTLLPIWATDASIASGPQSGETTKLEPSAGYKAAGAVPGRSIPGRYMNWLFNNQYTWVQYLDDLHNSAEFLNEAYPWTGAHSWTQDGHFLDDLVVDDQLQADTVVAQTGGVYIDHATANYNYLTPRSYTVAVPLYYNSTKDSEWAYAGHPSGSGAMAVVGSGGQMFVPLKHFLRTNHVITRVRAGHTATAGTMAMDLWYRSITLGSGAAPTALQIGTTQVAPGGTDIFDITGLSTTVAADSDYYVRFSGSTTADTVNWLAVTFTVPALRAD